MPYEVILVRKTRQAGAALSKRQWILQRLPVERTTGVAQKVHRDERVEFEEFKKDLEEDTVMRQGVNLWRDPQ